MKKLIAKKPQKKNSFLRLKTKNQKSFKITNYINFPLVFGVLAFMCFLPNYSKWFMLFVLLYNSFYFLFRNRFVLSLFRKFSLFLTGKKGTGKDVLFSWIYNSSSFRKIKKFSNIPYSEKEFNDIQFSDLSLKIDNIQLIENKLDVLPKSSYRKEFEKSIVFMSDSGVYLPSQYFSKLDKLYPSLPIYIALNRQLYNQQVHCNTQAFGRVWDKYREQFDFFIKIRSSFKGKMRRSLFSIVPSYKITLDIYSNEEDAKTGIIPRKKKKDNNTSQMLGDFKSVNVLVPMFMIKHDTHYFRKLLKV